MKRILRQVLLAAVFWAPEAYAGPSAADVKALVSDAYGKAVPLQAICLHTPSAPDLSNWTAVGVTQRRAGCRLLLLLRDGEAYPVATASKTLMDDVWATLTPEQQGERLRLWVHALLLAFDHPLEHASGPATRRADGWTIPLTFVQRSDQTGGTLYTETTFTFDNTLELIASPRDQGLAFQTRLLSNPYRTRDVDEEQVRAALHTKGQAFQECFQEAWQRDLELSGPVRIQMTISGGAANALGVVAEDNTDETLGQCYVRVLRRTQFPTAIEGTLIWSFTADRRTVSN